MVQAVPLPCSLKDACLVAVPTIFDLIATVLVWLQTFQVHPPHVMSRGDVLGTVGSATKPIIKTPKP